MSLWIQRASYMLSIAIALSTTQRAGVQ